MWQQMIAWTHHGDSLVSVGHDPEEEGDVLDLPNGRPPQGRHAQDVPQAVVQNDGDAGQLDGARQDRDVSYRLEIHPKISI